MDAARLAFADAQFDAVICVEAAFHFDTRAAFLREALRVLKPAGALTSRPAREPHLGHCGLPTTA
jgi:ubiquinone/menaquinone biosynthesis C-methylase UbiE